MRNPLGHIATALVAIAAAQMIADPASAQLEVGGRPFSGNSDSGTDPANNSNDSNQRVQRVQRDLVTLGYEPGSINGTMDDDTVMAIAKFQTENGLTPDGKVSPLLAGVLSAKVDEMRSGTVSESGAATANLTGAATAGNSDCERQSQEADEEAERSRGLANAGSRLLRRFGGNRGRDALETADDVAEVADIVDDIDGC